MGSFIPTEMILDRLALALRPTTRFIGLEGPARSAKTGFAIQGIYYAMLDPMRNAKVGLIGAKNLDKINQNILKKEGVGFLTTHPDCKIVKDEIGGYYIAVPTSQGIKKILLAGYDNKQRWQSILGGDIDVALIDEANIADENFLNEVEARQIACDYPLTIYTTNGDNPDNYIYQNSMNYGKIIGNCPASTRALIEQFQATKGVKPGYYYSFFAMADNPIMTPEKLERAQSVFPIGSYYHKTKILGERGVQGSLIFNEYMNPEKLQIDAYEKDQYGNLKYRFFRYTIGADIGETRAFNSYVLIGWLRDARTDYKECVVLKAMSFQKVGYNIKRVRLQDFVKLCIADGMAPGLCEGIAMDSAEQNFIADLDPLFSREFNIRVFGSYKATIKDRIDMNIVGFSTGRVRFNKRDATVMKIYAAYETSTWVENKIGEERLDANVEANDLMDSTEYAETKHMKALMRAGD